MKFLLIFCSVLLGGFAAGSPTAAFLDKHIVWEQSFDQLPKGVPETAAVDRNGTLWIVTSGSDPSQLVRIDANGRLLDYSTLPPTTAPQPPSEIAWYHETVTSLGAIALLVDYSHGGREQYSDGAKLGFFDANGRLSPLKRVTEPGQRNDRILALSDGYLLVLGDSSPMEVSRVSPDGSVAWRKNFSKDWVLPHGTPLEDGSACISSQDSAGNGLHLMRIDSAGIVQHTLEIDARNGVPASGPDGGCTVLYGRTRDLKLVEFSLAAFDPMFRRQWTMPVTVTARWGATYHLLRLSDGYLVCTDTPDGLFVAKYNFAGHLLWSGTDSTRSSPSFAIGYGDEFYFIRFRSVIRGK